ncbi:MAG: YqiA/YcfP family alpha/beta fold hydrolase [Pseudomonadota bacterium]
MPPTLTEYARMALDAYDYRRQPGDESAPTFADPAFDETFTDYVHLPLSGEYGPRNSTTSFPNGLDFNVYLNESAEEIVIAFRGTEFTAFFEALDDFELKVIEDNNLDRDVLTLFGYYQDGGTTLEQFIDDQGGVEAYLRDVLGVDPQQADRLADGLNLLTGNVFGNSVEAAIEQGEAALRSQVRQAIDSVLRIAADNPGTTITVTGHSLGGALAAYVAAALGVPAVVFDPAPYAAEALLDETRLQARELLAGPFSGLDPADYGWRDVAGVPSGTVVTGPPGANPSPEQAAADLIETVRLDGSFVAPLYLSASPLDLPPGTSTDTVIALSAEGVSPLDLHSMDLHALVIESAEAATPERPAFADILAGLPRLLATIYDSAPVVSPDTDDPATFLRYLTVEDAYYSLFVALFTQITAQRDAYTAEGADTTGLVDELTARALALLGEIADGQSFADGNTVEDAFGVAAGSAGDDVLVGASGVNEAFTPGLGTDFLATGLGDDDTVRASAAEYDGDTLFDFAPGDRLVFLGAEFAQGDVALSGDGRTLNIDTDGNGSADTTLALGRQVEAAALSVVQGPAGTVIGFDLAVAEVQRVALLYEAGLGRIADEPGLNFWIDQREAGLLLGQLASAFLSSPEFIANVGDPDVLDDRALVSALYRNVLGREGEAAGIDFWTATVAQPGFSDENLLLAFADSPENRTGSPEIETLAEALQGEWAFA